MGTWNGLNRWIPSAGRCRRFFSDPNDPATLSSNRVISLHLDRAGMLWIGSYGGGVCRMDPRTGRRRSFGIREGLPDDVVYALLEDDRHDIWMSTNRGLSRFIALQGTFPNYDEEDGLQSNQFFWGAAFRSRRGELFFVRPTGSTAFRPDPGESRPAAHRSDRLPDLQFPAALSPWISRSPPRSCCPTGRISSPSSSPPWTS